MSTPVVLVTGLYDDARAAAVNRLLRRHPGALAILYDPHPPATGRIERVIRCGSGILNRHVVSLARSSVTGAVRANLPAELIRLAATTPLVIVDLGDRVEPRPIAEALTAVEAIRLTCVLTVLNAADMPVDICRGDRLTGSGGPDAPAGPRHLAEVLAHQIEYGTALMLHGGDEEDIDLSAAVLGHLAPHTPIVTEPDVMGPALCVNALAERVDPATAQLPCDAQTGVITTLVWRRLRPLHPGRLFDVMEELATTTVRSRGRFWLANRHQRMLVWDAAGGAVAIRDAGPWLAGLPAAVWDVISPVRRAAAALDWNPIIGDRVQHLAFTGPELDRERICGLLDSCLINSEDALPGAAEWAGYDDPFSPLLDAKAAK